MVFSNPAPHVPAPVASMCYVPVDNTHPLLEIGAALYKSVGCTRGNTVTKMRRV